uniref:Uncharacterized protein n=1 Tax=Anguilla anguilla TaxID=7936 RepID=A0A0E9P880_ANGAN
MTRPRLDCWLTRNSQQIGISMRLWNQ